MTSIVNEKGRRYQVIQYNEFTHEAVLMGDMKGEFRTAQCLHCKLRSRLA